MNRELKEIDINLIDPDPENPRITENLKNYNIKSYFIIKMEKEARATQTRTMCE